MVRQLPKLTIIIPCYQEEESIPVLVEKLIPPLEAATGGSWSILFVDDGSTDATPELIWKLNQQDSRFQGIRFTRNFGHQPAVATGIQKAEGECIAVIDCDLQDPVDVLLEMYQKVATGDFDVCSGIRGKRENTPWWLRAAYRLFYRVMNAMAEHDYTIDSGDFSVFNQKAHQALLSLPETLWVPRGLRSWIGLRQTSVTYLRPAREYGQSKYNLSRLIRLAMSNITSFSTAPLRAATWIGVSMGFLTLLAGAFFLINRLFPEIFPFGYSIREGTGTATLVLYGSFVASMMFFCLGIMGEYLAVVIKEVKRRPVALIRETTPGLLTEADETRHW